MQILKIVLFQYRKCMLKSVNLLLGFERKRNSRFKMFMQLRETLLNIRRNFLMHF